MGVTVTAISCGGRSAEASVLVDTTIQRAFLRLTQVWLKLTLGRQWRSPEKAAALGTTWNVSTYLKTLSRAFWVLWLTTGDFKKFAENGVKTYIYFSAKELLNPCIVNSCFLGASWRSLTWWKRRKMRDGWEEEEKRKNLGGERGRGRSRQTGFPITQGTVSNKKL